MLRVLQRHIKMRIILVFILILYVTNYAKSGARNREILKYVKAKVYGEHALHNPEAQERILLRSVDPICPESGSKAWPVINKAFNCMETIDMVNETLCDAIRNNSETCLKPVKEFFEECLPERSKSIPNFVIKSFINAVDYVCTADAEHVFELTNTCLFSRNIELESCSRKVDKFERELEEAPTTEDVCTFGKMLKDCFQLHLSATCEQKKTRESFLGLIDALLFQCNDTIAAK